MKVYGTALKSGALARALILLGVVLVLFNIVGYFLYTKVNSDDEHLLDAYPLNISEKEFWDGAYRKNGEALEEYLRRFTKLVSERMLRIEPTYAKPTVFENWILWIYSNIKDDYEWSDTKRAVRLGGGYCSQHAIVFNNLLREQDIESRILGLQGHVVNEVLVNGGWKVYDSDYNVVFDATLQDLENDPYPVYQAYIGLGASDDTAKLFQEAFATEADNFRYKKTRAYREEKYHIEVAALYLVWVIPVFLILVGIRLRYSAA